MNHFPRAWDTQTSRDLAPEKSSALCWQQVMLCTLRCQILSGLIYLSIWLQKHDEYTASAHAHRDVGSNYSVSYLGPC